MSEEKDLINADADVVSSEDYDAEMAALDPGEPAPKKRKKLKKWQIITIAVVSVVLIVIIGLLSWLLPVLLTKGDTPVIGGTSTVEGYGIVIPYIGNNTYDGEGTDSMSKKIDLKKTVFAGEAFANATLEVKGNANIGSIEGSTLTTTDTVGDMVVKVTIDGKSTDYKVVVVKGYNVFNYAQLKATAALKEQAIVVQADMDFNKKTDVIKGETIELYSDLYGNAHKIDATNFTNETDIRLIHDTEKDKSGYKAYKRAWDDDVITSETAFELKKDNLKFYNAHVVGKELPTKEYKHNEYVDGGINLSAENLKGIEIKYNVFEKAHKNVQLLGVEAVIEGNLFREVADGCIGIGTHEEHPASKVLVKDNVFINPQVAAIINYMFKTPFSPPMLELTIEGKFEIYNWKNEDSATLMPITEDFDEMINGLIQKELPTKQYDDMLIKHEEKRWVHIGIVILASGFGAKYENNPVINGTKITNASVKNGKELKISNIDGYIARELPFGGYADLASMVALKTGIMIGYKTNGDAGAKKLIAPNKVEINKALFEGLIYKDSK